jgi:NAD(P)H-nitrite reductase large subunit
VVGKVSRELVAPELDRFGIKAGDASKVREGGGVRLLGKRGDIPAALRLTHAAEQEVDLMVMASKLRVGPGLATATCTAMDNGVRLSCHLYPFLTEAEYIGRCALNGG